MKYLFGVAIVAGLALAPATSNAETAKKRSVHISQRVQVQPDFRGTVDQSGGNAAAGGNNANSMSGSNSAAENANGRSSGGYGG